MLYLCALIKQAREGKEWARAALAQILLFAKNQQKLIEVLRSQGVLGGVSPYIVQSLKTGETRSRAAMILNPIYCCGVPIFSMIAKMLSAESPPVCRNIIEAIHAAGGFPDVASILKIADHVAWSEAPTLGRILALHVTFKNHRPDFVRWALSAERRRGGRLAAIIGITEWTKIYRNRERINVFQVAQEIPLLVSLFSCQDRVVCEEAIQATSYLVKTAMSALGLSAQIEDPDIIKWLGTERVTMIANGLVKVLQESLSERARQRAAWAIHFLGVKSAIHVLERRLYEEPSSAVRKQIVWALIGLASEQAIPCLIKALRNERGAATTILQVLAKSQTKEAQEAILEAANHPSSYLYHAARAIITHQAQKEWDEAGIVVFD